MVMVVKHKKHRNENIKNNIIEECIYLYMKHMKTLRLTRDVYSDRVQFVYKHFLLYIFLFTNDNSI